MPVRLRISLQGKRNSRIMHIVASHAGASRDSKPLETLAIFSPRVNPDTGEKRVEWAVERMRYWLGVGAQPSKTVLALLERGGVVPRSPKRWDVTANLAPTPAYPASTPAHVRLSVFRHPAPSVPLDQLGSPLEPAAAASHGLHVPRMKEEVVEKAWREKQWRGKQLGITRQWTHDRRVLERGAKGGVPEARRRTPRPKAEGEEQKQGGRRAEGAQAWPENRVS